MRSFTVTAALLLTAPSALSQSILEEPRRMLALEPVSRTATAVTGPLSFSGDTLTFETGVAVDIVSRGTAWRTWSLNGGRQTAEIFTMASDPGPLRNGNTLCGGQVRHIVVYRIVEGAFPGHFGAVFFTGDAVPHDVDSPGLCMTATYTPSGG